MNCLTIFLLLANVVVIFSAPLEDQEPTAKYQFSYGVNDPYTNDLKTHEEESDGKVVRGSYSIDEADGSKRVVEYTADKEHGFQAVVKVIGENSHTEYYGHNQQGNDDAGDEHDNNDTPSSYHFTYGVYDPYTGDIKSQEEESDGKVVRGVYSLEELDGTTRVVKYTADDDNGFQAVVQRIGKAKHPK